MQHDWISFKYQLRHGFGGNDGRARKTFSEYIGVLLLLATPLLGGRSLDIGRLEEFAGGRELAALVRENMNEFLKRAIFLAEGIQYRIDDR